jgi:uncharacterized protein (TIGR03437 family)
MNRKTSLVSPFCYALFGVAIFMMLGFAAKPLVASDFSKMGPPAKITWSPSRLTEVDFTDGVATVEFTSSKDVAAVNIQATPSLSKFMTVEPASIMDVVAGTVYEVTITLLNPDEPPEHTLGGTIKVKEGNRTLAKPLSVSIKSEAGEEGEPEGEGEDGEGGEEGEVGEDSEDEVNTLTWMPEAIDASLFGESNEAMIVFTSTKEIEKVCLWVTPSAQSFLTVQPMMISPVLGDGTEHVLTLTLSPTLAELPRDVGGTLHVRQCDEIGKMRRTYDPPIGIQISRGAEEPVEADPEALVSSADFEVGPVAPNEIVSVFGQGLGPQEPTAFSAKSVTVDTVLANTQVLFNGTAAPMLSTQNGQVNTIVPAGVAGLADVLMRVLYNGKISAPYVVAITESSPALYALDGSGEGQGAILNSDLTVNSRSNRAARGSWIVLYGTGGGLGETVAPDGEILTEAVTLRLPVEVTVNRALAEVIWAGYPAGSVQGVVQVNVWLPMDPRIVFGEWPVVLKIGDQQSGDYITVAIE